MRPAAATVLEGHALALKADPTRALVVEGHADERGGAEYNLALGQKRAEAVVKTLLMLGAKESQLEAWTKNHRAELRPL